MDILCNKMLHALLTAYCAANNKNVSDLTIEDIAVVCKEQGYALSECVNCLYKLFGTTTASTADKMTKVIVKIWYGSACKPDIINALKALNAYADTDVDTAVKSNINLPVKDFYSTDTKLKKIISICDGDLTTLKPLEHTDFLIISALPNDYASLSGSMIGSLTSKGFNIKNESINKAADYRNDLDCWITQKLTTAISGLEFDHVLVYEPANPQTNAASKIGNIFKAIKRFKSSPQNPITINSSLVCTISGRAPKNDILTAFFNSAKANLLDESYPINLIRLSLFNGDAQLETLFKTLKSQ